METGRHYIRLLREELTQRCERNAKYSLRSFARSLQVPAGVLSNVLAGKSVPSPKRARQILAGLPLSPEDQKLFLGSVVEAHAERPLKRRSRALAGLAAPVAPTRDLNLDLFRVISDWYHYAILMMAKVPGFQDRPHWIARRLDISETEAMLALERLKELGMLEKSKGLWKVKEGFTTADKHLTTAALRKHQRQMLEKSIAALDEVPLERRNTTSYTMAIDPRKLPQARKIIADATQSLSALLESGQRTQVYQFCATLFPLEKEIPNEN